MTASKVMIPKNELYICNSDDSVSDIMGKLGRSDFVLIKPKRGFFGWKIFTDRDLVHFLHTGKDRNTPVWSEGNLLSWSVQHDSLYDECLKMFGESEVRHLPVLNDDGNLIGILTIEHMYSAW